MSSGGNIRAARKIKKLIIRAVERHPCVYDKSNKEYKDPDELNAAWENISENTGLSAYECKETWTKLRNSFVNAVKRRRRKPSIAKWVYEDAMQFIIPHLCFRSTSMFSAGCEPTPKLERLSPEPESDRATTDNELPDPSNAVALGWSNAVDSESSAGGSDDADPGPSRSRAGGERAAPAPDAIELFFLSVAAAARALPRARRVRVRMRVSDAVGAAELRALTSPQHRTRKRRRSRRAID